MRSELAIIDLTLLARKSNKIPLWQGRAAQALFYHTLQRIHPLVSETIHDLHKWHPIMPKPFTMSTLIGHRVAGDLLVIERGERLRLRLTTLHPDLTRIALQGVLPIWGREGVVLHNQDFRIVRTRYQKATYAALLADADDHDCVMLNFTAPTAFKRTDGGTLSRPDPAYIFNSLFNRWNGFAADPLPDTLKATIEAHLYVIDAPVQHHTLKFARGRKGVFKGFYGPVHVRIDTEDTHLCRMLNALAAFAPFSGVGIKTTIGMGQVWNEGDG